MITKATYTLEAGKIECSSPLSAKGKFLAHFPHKTRSRLAGRIAAKKAIKEYCRQTSRADFSGITVEHRESGAPFLSLAKEKTKSTPLANISISHAGDHGVAVVFDAYEGRIGVDVEHIKRFTLEFGARFLSQDELKWACEEGHEQGWSRRMAFLWSVKEAYLKALGVGLRKDPRKVIIQGPQEGVGDIVIFDEGEKVPCSIFWYMAYYDHIIVGVSI